MAEPFIDESLIISATKKLLKKAHLTSESLSEDVFFVFITRKGYWVFREAIKDSDASDNFKDFFRINSGDITAADDNVSSVCELSRNYCTDRYIFKQTSFEFLRGRKKIVLFDDSITDGYNLLRHYVEISKRLSKIYVNDEKPQIIPMVLAVNTEFLDNGLALSEDTMKSDILKSYKREELLKAIESIKSNLIYEYLLSPEDIARLCIEETKMFQKHLSPLVMDLPIYDSIKSADEDDGHERTVSPIHLSTEEFERLCAFDNKWEYIKNSYSIQGQEICCDYFIYNDYFLNQRFGKFFMNFVVKIKYNKTDAGIDAVFIPFAMVKSCSFLDMWRCFNNLFCGTSYYNEIIRYLDEKAKNPTAGEANCDYEDILKDKDKYGIDDNLYRGAYRAIISSISMHLMRVFSQRLKAIANIDVKYNKKHFLESNSHVYVRSVYESVYGSKGDRTISDYAEIISKIRLSNSPLSSSALNIGDNLIKATYENVEYEIRDLVVQRKNKGQILLIEDMEDAIVKKFSFETLTQKDRYLTRTIILLLELSCIGNEVHIDSDKKMILRSFRHGENCENLMPVGIKWIFPYIFALYYYKNDEFFCKNISDFSEWLYNEFDINGYFETHVSQDEFAYILKYFKSIAPKRLNRQIQNKLHYLDDYREGGEQSPLKYFMERAFSKTTMWSEAICER